MYRIGQSEAKITPDTPTPEGSISPTGDNFPRRKMGPDGLKRSCQSPAPVPGGPGKKIKGVFAWELLQTPAVAIHDIPA